RQAFKAGITPAILGDRHMSSTQDPGSQRRPIALVTGASSGIGRATAARLALIGAIVIVGYNSRREAAEEVMGGLQGDGHMALRIAIEDPVSIAEAAREITQRFGRLDILVNNAGTTQPVPANDLEGLSDE